MSALLPRDKLAAVLARLESPYDGERAAAGLLASRMVRAAGMSWQDVVTPPAPAATSPHTAPDPPDWYDMVQACRAACPGRLTDWERDFVDVLAGYTRRPSDRQLAVLERLHAKVSGS